MEEGKAAQIAVSPLIFVAGAAPRIGDQPDYQMPPKRTQIAMADGQAIETHSDEPWRCLGIEYLGRTFVFNRELVVRITIGDGGCSFDSDDPELFGFGSSYPEARHVFCIDFISCWDDIACEDDSKLTHEARELKRALLGLVKEVKQQ